MTSRKVPPRCAVETIIPALVGPSRTTSHSSAVKSLLPVIGKSPLEGSLSAPRYSPVQAPLCVAMGGLVGLAEVGARRPLGGRRIAARKAVFVAVPGDALEPLLGQLETLGLTLAALDQRLLGGIVGVVWHLAADLAGLGGSRLGLFL